MDIITLCSAVKDSLHYLNGARSSGVLNHKKVEEFQESIKDILNKSATGYLWDTEVQAKGRIEKDSIDIFGQAKGQKNWIIEIDATRTDQVSQKLLSRLSLWGKKDPIQYVAILYPDAQNKGKSACEKYLRYGNEICQIINKNSSVLGIFVDPVLHTVEVLQFDQPSHFYVNGTECKSMTDAAAEAVKAYLTKHPKKFKQLKSHWGKFVDDQRGPSRYKDVGMKTTDGVPVYTYTQFRQHGLSSYWTDFVRNCKKNGIVVSKMRKVFVGKSTTNPFIFIV